MGAKDTEQREPCTLQSLYSRCYNYFCLRFHGNIIASTAFLIVSVMGLEPRASHLKVSYSALAYAPRGPHTF